MVRPIPFVLFALLTVACDPGPPTRFSTSAVPGGSSAGSTEQDGGRGDAGPGDAGPAGDPLDAGSLDAGSPTACADETDGKGSALPALVFSEVATGAESFVEVFWRGPSTLDARDVDLVLGGGSQRLGTGELAAGTRLSFGRSLPVSGEAALVKGAEILAYVCWGSPETSELQARAAAANVWPFQTCLELVAEPSQSQHLTGAGTNPLDYQVAPRSRLDCVP